MGRIAGEWMDATDDIHAILFRLEGVRSAGPNRWLARCPAHDDRNPSLSVRWTGDKVLLYCFAGCSYRDIVEALGLRSDGPRAYFPKPRLKPKPEPPPVNASALELWGRGHPISGKGHPVLLYLRARGLELLEDPPELRYLPLLTYYEEGKPKGDYPVMLGAVRDRVGEVINVHRTYLSRNHLGKAPVRSPKKLSSGSSSGGGIWLYPPGPVVAVAEGIETALAVHIMTRLPVIATISASHMAQWEPPPIVKEVLIAADADRAGIRGAQRLHERLAALGVRSAVYAPPRGMDWLDAYLEGLRIY